MVPPGLPETVYLPDIERRPAGEPGGKVCPRCSEAAVILGDDEEFFCQNCGYKESEGK